MTTINNSYLSELTKKANEIENQGIYDLSRGSVEINAKEFHNFINLVRGIKSAIKYDQPENIYWKTTIHKHVEAWMEIMASISDRVEASAKDITINSDEDVLVLRRVKR